MDPGVARAVQGISPARLLQVIEQFLLRINPSLFDDVDKRKLFRVDRVQPRDQSTAVYRGQVVHSFTGDPRHIPPIDVAYLAGANASALGDILADLDRVDTIVGRLCPSAVRAVDGRLELKGFHQMHEWTNVGLRSRCRKGVDASHP